MIKWVPKCAGCGQVPNEVFIETQSPNAGNIYCGGCRLDHPTAVKFDDRVRGRDWMTPDLNGKLDQLNED